MKKELRKILKISSLGTIVVLFLFKSVIVDGSTIQTLPNTGEETAKTGMIVGGIILVSILLIIILRRKRNKE